MAIYETEEHILDKMCDVMEKCVLDEKYGIMPYIKGMGIKTTWKGMWEVKL